MSSTKRGGIRSVSDYYVTPIEDIKLFFDGLRNYSGLFQQLQNGNILDSCAGGNDEIRDGNGVREMFHPMSYPTAIKTYFGNYRVSTCDIRNDSLATVKADYLTMDYKGKFDVIITNPPFAIAMDVIRKALDDVKDSGFVVMLLRLNYLGSQERKPFFDKFMPTEIYVHHKRICFIERKDSEGYVVFDKRGSPIRGSSDSVEYCHMVWHKGEYPDHCILRIV